MGFWFQTSERTSSGVRAVLPPIPCAGTESRLGNACHVPPGSSEHKGIGVQIPWDGAAAARSQQCRVTVCRSAQHRVAPGAAPRARSRLARRSHAVTATKLVTPVTKQPPRLPSDIHPQEQGCCAWGGLLLGGSSGVLASPHHLCAGLRSWTYRAPLRGHHYPCFSSRS